MNKCPKCGELENFHYNYDYSKAERPVLDILCNECGEFFHPSLDIPKVKKDILTAEDFWIQNQNPHRSQLEVMIEFAKLHCKAQSKAILENVTIDDIGSPNGDGEWMPCNIINKDSIMNAYPLTNIK